MAKKLLSINEKIVFRPEEEFGILFNPETNLIKVLNETGVFIWNLSNGQHSKEEIAQKLREEYPDAAGENLEQDVEIFLNEMKKYNLIFEVEKNCA